MGKLVTASTVETDKANIIGLACLIVLIGAWGMLYPVIFVTYWSTSENILTICAGIMLILYTKIKI